MTNVASIAQQSIVIQGECGQNNIIIMAKLNLKIENKKYTERRSGIILIVVFGHILSSSLAQYPQFRQCSAGRAAALTSAGQGWPRA